MGMGNRVGIDCGNGVGAGESNGGKIGATVIENKINKNAKSHLKKE